ncbi:hypothetical protein HOY80DRAFT_1138031 [Tuber brumale]|nr:hypothetical protein HOY80DRAFT_1138031 [Tuber brumale]
MLSLTCLSISCLGKPEVPLLNTRFLSHTQISNSGSEEEEERVEGNMPTQSEEENPRVRQAPNPDWYYHSGLGLYLDFPIGAIEHPRTIEFPQLTEMLPPNDNNLEEEEAGPEPSSLIKSDEHHRPP